MENDEISGVAIPGRQTLNADQLHDLRDAQPRLEKERRFKTPGGAMGEITPTFFFSIDGMLNGQTIKGALFAGECMVIQAPTFEAAYTVAKDGLAETIRLLREEYEIRPAPLNAGLSTDIAGRRGQPGGDLRTDPKLKSMLAHIIGGLPWKH